MEKMPKSWHGCRCLGGRGGPVLFLAWFSSLGSPVTKETAKGGACSVAQDCIMSHLARSDPVLWGEVRVWRAVKYCRSQHLPFRGLGSPRRLRTQDGALGILHLALHVHSALSTLCSVPPEVDICGLPEQTPDLWVSQWAAQTEKLRTGEHIGGIESFISLPAKLWVVCGCVPLLKVTAPVRWPS